MALSRRHRRHHGQAIVELALTLPVLVLLTFGATDLGRAFYFRLPVATVASAGVRDGTSAANGNAWQDIGTTMRTQSSVMPNNAATWGSAYTANCTATSVSNQTCGDYYTSPANPGGCTATSVFWNTTPKPTACFAVRSCTIDSKDTTSHTGQCAAVSGCTAFGNWGTRPASGAAVQPAPACLDALQVVVVYRFVPATPIIGNLMAGTGRALYISYTVTEVENY
ncbi:MAG: TadE/TadG family type IV pilus assembly protein [Candidatus Dormibacteria bacterium]